MNPFAAALGDPDRLHSRMSDRLKMMHDASHYALLPQAVAVPVDGSEVGALLAVSAANGIPMTFRSGGTSLSGQAGTDGILVDTRRHFRSIDVLDDGLPASDPRHAPRAPGHRPERLLRLAAPAGGRSRPRSLWCRT